MANLRTLILLLLVVPVSRADDWPQWLGPKRDGATTEKIVAWKETPKKLWEHPVADDSGNEYRELCTAKVCGRTLTSPAILNGRLYVSDDKNVICYQLGE